VTLPFEKRSEVVSLFRVPDDQLFRTAQFVLTVSGEKAERMVIDEVPRKVKIAAPDVIDQLVVLGETGTRVDAMPPSHLSASDQGRTSVFPAREERSSYGWHLPTGILALFIPAEFKSMQLKLLAVKEKF